MSQPLDMYVYWIITGFDPFLGTNIYQITYDPQYVEDSIRDPEFRVVTLDTVADEPNGVFVTIEDAMEYYREFIHEFFVDSINNILSPADPFVVGDVYFVPADVYYYTNILDASVRADVSVAIEEVYSLATDRSNHTGAQAISTVTGLQASLDNKAALSHSHTISDVTGLQTVLNSKQATITTGTSAQYFDGTLQLKTFPAIPDPISVSSPSRSLNTNFKISDTRNALVSYTVDIAATLSLTGGATGTVILEYADTSAMTSATTVQSAVNGNTGTLTIGLALTQTGTATLTGVVPAGKFARIRTANTAGTPTFTYRSAQETLL